jgi:hypothetical protein
MATFDTLIKERKLIRVTVPLGRNQFHDRKFFACPDCLDWIRNEVPRMVTGRINSAFTPKEQLVERLRQWMAGEPMRYDRWFHDMDPKTDDVWELKTADLRIFGWIYRPREFIAACGGYTDDYKEPTKTKTYADEVRKVVAIRNALPLDGNKFATGGFNGLV